MTWLYQWACFSILVDTAHVFCPIALALWRRELRGWVWLFPLQFLALAAPLIICAPLRYVWVAYSVWNLWHFGAQNYGLICLGSHRRIGPWPKWFIIGGTAIGMFVPVVSPTLSVLHWTSDLYLSSRRSRAFWAFLSGMMIAGLAGFLWAEPTVRGTIQIIDPLLRFRVSLGFLHFIESREIWRRGSPIMAAA